MGSVRLNERGHASPRAVQRQAHLPVAVVGGVGRHKGVHLRVAQLGGGLLEMDAHCVDEAAGRTPPRIRLALRASPGSKSRAKYRARHAPLRQRRRHLQPASSEAC